MNINELKEFASIARSRIILNSHKTGTPHLGSCLSCVDILVALYFSKLKINPKDHKSPHRDRFILSKGHGAAALFFFFLMKGMYPEGSIWEAATMAVAQKVENLTIFVDSNKWQATDRSADLAGHTSMKNKWSSFGWNSCEIDGNNMQEIINILSEKPTKGIPTAVMLNTIKGRGVSFMEDNNNWHYRIPNEEEVRAAFKELGVEL